MTADLLCRLITTIPVESLENVSEIFPLLTAQTRGIQRSAYEVLHRYIPKTQEQVSFDVALTKSTVRLPEELLSLLREAPTMESISSSHGEGKMWIRLRSYLLSWKVVFDHFSNAVRYWFRLSSLTRISSDDRGSSPSPSKKTTHLASRKMTY